MNEARITERIGWLGMALTAQRNNLARLLLRLKDVGLRAGTSLALHRKFMHMMEQVAVDKSRETEILNEIEAIEKQHQDLKKRKMLRCVSRTKTTQTVHAPSQAQHPKEEEGQLLKVFSFLFLLSRANKNNKKQDLIAD